ncbi:hypothetical protein ACJMK2_021561 [Sinanodonta woodiana]|uniref:Peptidase M12B domain-containing protein n=1 Tax=Sinanodonta woodiana TaxID=1069815 RepID=A0ABD3TGF4_SINWO
MHGVNQIYKGIEDSGISIDVIISTFYVFKRTMFPFKASEAKLFNNTKRIEAVDYLLDAQAWDKKDGKKIVPDVDHVMLFTRYNMYFDTPENTGVVGFTHTGGVCSTGKRISIVEERGLFWTIFTAAHELGHSLGACHDGEDCAKACKASDSFIMSAKVTDLNMTSSANNPWRFSICSVRSFKETLMRKPCVLEQGEVFNAQEYQSYVENQPGETYDATEQCRFLTNRYSKVCEIVMKPFAKYLRELSDFHD